MTMPVPKLILAPSPRISSAYRSVRVLNVQTDTSAYQIAKLASRAFVAKRLLWQEIVQKPVNTDGLIKIVCKLDMSE
jgi:hypothetical protein